VERGMIQHGQRIYRLDGAEIDTAQLCLKRNGAEQHLRAKTFQVLIYLLEQRDRLVAKEELIGRIWPDTAVTDNTLEQCLAEIRRALGDNPRQPRFIKTIPRAGYRFIGSVEEIGREAEALPSENLGRDNAGDRAPSVARSRVRWRPMMIAAAVLLVGAVTVLGWYFKPRRTSGQTLMATTLPQDPTRRPVAVMFFDNESDSADLDWLREGLADMIITDLSRSNNLAVLSRQQLHVLLEHSGHNQAEKIRLDEALSVAHQTQAKLLVLGSFAKLGDEIRIDAHLHDARDGQLLGAERVVVSEPARVLTQVDLLSAKLASYMSGGPPAANVPAPAVITNSLEAFHYYSLGVEKAQSLRTEEALTLLQKAVALDPNFAMAYARLGYFIGVTGNYPDKAKPYLEKAFQFQDRLTDKDKLEIQAWYAIVNYDYAGAIDAFRKLVAAYPLEVEAYRRLALLLKGEMKHQEALEVLKQALVIDPSDRDLYNALSAVYSEMGHHEDAVAMAQHYVQLAPNEPNAHDTLGLVCQWAGRYDEANQEYQRALQLKPDFQIAMVHLGNLYFQEGRYRAAIEEYQHYVQAAATNAERERGYGSIGYVEMRRGDLAAAERDAVQALHYEKMGFALPYFIALARNDLPQARKLEKVMENLAANDRGARSSLRTLYYYRGMLALRGEATDEAIENFKLAVSHRPPTWNFDAWEDCTANAYLQVGRLDEAIAEYQRIEDLNRNYPLLHYHLGQAYERKGQREAARSEYEHFLQDWKDADPDGPEVVAAKKSLSG